MIETFDYLDLQDELLLDRYHWARQGLVAHYPMNEGGGNTIYDVSGNQNHGVFASGSSSPLWVDGVLTFDGSNDSFSTPAMSFASGDAWSVSFWVKRNGAGYGANPGIFRSEELGHGVWVSSAGRVWGRHNVADFSSSGTGKDITDGKWYYFVFGWDKSYRYMYSDGSLYYSAAITTNAAWTVVNFGTQNSEYLDGCLKNIRFYRRMLSDSEIMELYYNPYPEYNRTLWAGAVAAGGGRTTKNTDAFPLGDRYGMSFGFRTH